MKHDTKMGTNMAEINSATSRKNDLCGNARERHARQGDYALFCVSGSTRFKECKV